MSILENGKPGNGKPKQLKYEPTRNDPASYSLTEEEREAIREKARLTVANEIKDREEKALYDLYLAEERQDAIPEESLQPIWLNLALHSPYIMLDGRQYLNETLYNVPQGVFQVLSEQMARGWAHENETQVRDTRTRRRHEMTVSLNVSNYGDHRRARELKTSSATLGAAVAKQQGVVNP